MLDRATALRIDTARELFRDILARLIKLHALARAAGLHHADGVKLCVSGLKDVEAAHAAEFRKATEFLREDR